MMISVKEAKSLVEEHVACLPLHMVPLAMAAGATLGKDVYAKIDIPAFEQSSMDGYAIRYDERNLPLIINGELRAGTDHSFTLLPEQAVRIFAGAPLPFGADTVVMQENVEISNGMLAVKDEELKPGLNVSHKGAVVQHETLAMAKGCKLTPAALGFLAGMGCHEVEICQTPAVAIIVTGKELQRPGEELQFGQVYESNSYSLTAALELAQITKISFFSADDDPDQLTAVLDEALTGNDVVLLTGGISVGDYDFVLQATEKAGVERIFHRISQKPGSPLYFGKKNKKVVFGLPGKPSSVLGCFYQYVLPALERMTCYISSTAAGEPSGSLKAQDAILSEGLNKPAGITHFVSANYNDGKVTPLSAQESSGMSSFVQANCMIELEEDKTDFAAGTEVKIYILPE